MHRTPRNRSGFTLDASGAELVILSVRHHGVFMKRLVCIVLWTVCFAVMTFSVWMMTWDWLGRSGIATVWTDSTVNLIRGMVSCTYFAMPLLGLILGLFGKLPGTKFSQNPRM
jgi:hypothetical protein